MRFIEFLADKRLSILGYALLMLFISLVIYLDGSIRVAIGNIIYINLVSASFYIGYLLLSYLYNKNYYSTLITAVDDRDDVISRMPEPVSYEQSLFRKILLASHEEHESKISRMYREKKEYEEFITSWVHQVKTPVSVVRLLIENGLTSPDKRTLVSIEEEIEKIDNYVEQALYYSKISDFSKDYFIHEIDADRLVKDSVKRHAKSFINKKISIEIWDTDFVVISDKQWLSFILTQLLTNALKYTPSGGLIKIYGKKEERVHKLVVEDNGIGIKPEDIGRVFDKSFTGYNGRQNYKSTGIGLYLSKKLAEKLGHDLLIESEYGQYTRAVIVFPKLSDYLLVTE